MVDNISKASKSVLPLYTSHTGASLTSRKARMVGQVFSFVNASTVTIKIPGTPPIPTLLRATGGLIGLLLYSPDDTGGVPVQDFTVYLDNQKLDGDTLAKESTKSGLKLTTKISIGDLKPLTNYTIQVVALNSYSRCFFGQVYISEAVVFTTTGISAPDAPQLAPQRETGAGITVSMIDPKDKGGSPIQRYQLYHRASTSSPDAWVLGYSGDVHQAQVARLRPSNVYVFKASVFNGYFESANSSEFTRHTTPPSPPGPCEAPTLISATGGMLNVSWELPIDDGGSTISKYIVTLSSDADGSGKDVRFAFDPFIAFYSLAPKRDYRIEVQAINVKGTGPKSDPKVFTTIEGTPPVGLIDVKVLQTTGGAAVIAFNPPLDLGGADQFTMAYQVFIDRECTLTLAFADLESSQVKSVTTTSALSASSSASRRLSEAPGAYRRLVSSSAFAGVVISGLDPEALYNIQLKPLSGFGSGRTTTPTAAITIPTTTPSKPLNIATESVTGGLVTMTWDAPVDTGGAPLNEYDLYLSVDSAAGPFLSVCRDVVTKCRVDLLAPGTTYWFYVLVRNDVGDSPPSGTISVTTKDITPPSSPRYVRIEMVGFDSVDCAWEVPEDFGGNDIARYSVVITSLNDGSQVVTATPVTTVARVESLAPSTAYSIILVRTNSAIV